MAFAELSNDSARSATRSIRDPFRPAWDVYHVPSLTTNTNIGRVVGHPEDQFPLKGHFCESQLKPPITMIDPKPCFRNEGGYPQLFVVGIVPNLTFTEPRVVIVTPVRCYCRNPAPPKPRNDASPVNSNAQWFQPWFPSGAKRISSIHSLLVGGKQKDLADSCHLRPEPCLIGLAPPPPLGRDQRPQLPVKGPLLLLNPSVSEYWLLLTPLQKKKKNNILCV